MGCTMSSSRHSGEDIRNCYRIGCVLGSGSFGQVRLCTRIGTGETYAVKIMAKSPPRKKSPKIDYEDMFKNEVSMLQALDHENVVRFLEFFEDRHFLYAVMEKCDGGELFTKIVRQKKFNEENASQLARQMLTAINYVHSLSIVHRDIKAENFLFKLKDDLSPLLLIDFGMATKLEGDNQLTQLCGSPHYVAPELIRRQYRFQVDMWALGVMIYLMLFGKYPFEAQDHKTIVQQILKTEPDYAKGSVQPSPMAIDFMKKLLSKNPEKRMTAKDALNHEWVSTDMAAENRSHSVSDDIIREAHRKSTLDREELEPDKQKEMDEKLAQLQSDYRKGRFSHSRKLSGLSGASGHQLGGNAATPSGHSGGPPPTRDPVRQSNTRRMESVTAHGTSRMSVSSSCLTDEPSELGSQCTYMYSGVQGKRGTLTVEDLPEGDDAHTDAFACVRSYYDSMGNPYYQDEYDYDYGDDGEEGDEGGYYEGGDDYDDELEDDTEMRRMRILEIKSSVVLHAAALSSSSSSSSAPSSSLSSSSSSSSPCHSSKLADGESDDDDDHNNNMSLLDLISLDRYSSHFAWDPLFDYAALGDD